MQWSVVGPALGGATCWRVGISSPELCSQQGIGDVRHGEGVAVWGKIPSVELSADSWQPCLPEKAPSGQAGAPGIIVAERKSPRALGPYLEVGGGEESKLSPV
jgi:hypothetical protein